MRVSSNKKIIISSLLSVFLSSQSLAFDFNTHKDIKILGEFSLASVKNYNSDKYKNFNQFFTKDLHGNNANTNVKNQRFANVNLATSYIAIPKPNSLRKYGIKTRKSVKLNSGLFGTKAVAFSPITSQDDWDRVRHSSLSLDPKHCEISSSCVDTVDKFKTIVETAADQKFYDKLTLVNKSVNSQITYNEDIVTYRKADYWASAQETLRRGWGDCEDYAILKYKLLLKLGVPAKSMSLVVLKDTSRNLYHAVLAISTSKGNFILDNVRDVVYQDAQIAHYQPLYSFSDNRSWIHGKPAKKGGATPLTMAHGFNKIAPGKSFDDGEKSLMPSIDFTLDILPKTL